MKIHIPTQADSFGMTSEENIENVKQRMEFIARDMGFDFDFYDYAPDYEAEDEDDRREESEFSERVFELAMECADPQEGRDSPELIAALADARKAYPFS